MILQNKSVEAPMADIVQGSGLVIRGTVMDVSAGTQQPQQKADFPNGVPAVSDASQSAWIRYVYMQKPILTTASGVSVSIDVVDSNGNYRNIGTAQVIQAAHSASTGHLTSQVNTQS